MQELISLNNQNQPTMSSREIADLVEKRHDNVMRDIRDMLAELANAGDVGVLKIEETPYRNEQNGQYYTEFNLNQDLTLTLVSGYSIVMRNRIIKRWMELEQKPAAPRELTRLELLQLAMDSEQKRIAAENKRDHAIATKAEIGTRREATAMNTASQAVKTAHKLEIELDRSKEYATVKRMSMLYHGQSFKWQLLKSTSIEMGIPPIPVFDQNYGTCNAYHADVWREAYALSI